MLASVSRPKNSWVALLALGEPDDDRPVAGEPQATREPPRPAFARERAQAERAAGEHRRVAAPGQARAHRPSRPAGRVGAELHGEARRGPGLRRPARPLRRGAPP